MHLNIILLIMAAIWGIREGWRLTTPSVSSKNWLSRWQRALQAFLLPPLLLLMTAVAVLLMGTHGYMLGLPVGWMGYLLALSFLGYAGVRLLGLTLEGWRSLKTVEQYGLFNFKAAIGHILDTSILFAAQVGFWNSRLVVSQGLLDTLDEAQLEAVMTHEEAHRYYHDTFWFFWLGWLRQITIGLPHTDALWQELLLLRELRADQWAAQRVDGLVLAETLLQVVKEPISPAGVNWAALGTATPVSRLEERVEALVMVSDQSYQMQSREFIGMVSVLFPLLTLFLHQ